MQVHIIQNNNTSFNAQLKVDGQKLPKEFRKRVEKIVSEIGGDNDIVSITMGRQYDKSDCKFAEDHFHVIHFKRYFRDISITSVINGKLSKYCKSFERCPDARWAVKPDIIDYLKLLKLSSNKS